jgi:hypothetical protein
LEKSRYSHLIAAWAEEFFFQERNTSYSPTPSIAYGGEPSPTAALLAGFPVIRKGITEEAHMAAMRTFFDLPIVKTISYLPTGQEENEEKKQ